MAELEVRVGELENLKDQMHAVRISIAKTVSDGTLMINHDTNRFASGNVYS